MAIRQFIRPAIVRGSVIDSGCDGGRYREHYSATTAEWMRACGGAANFKRGQP